MSANDYASALLLIPSVKYISIVVPKLDLFTTGETMSSQTSEGSHLRLVLWTGKHEGKCPSVAFFNSINIH